MGFLVGGLSHYNSYVRMEEMKVMIYRILWGYNWDIMRQYLDASG